MTEGDGSSYKISISRKALGGQVFVNINSIFADPQNQELADRVVEDIESPGFGHIIVALGDRLDDTVREQVQRARGIYQARRAKQIERGRSTGSEGPDQ